MVRVFEQLHGVLFCPVSALLLQGAASNDVSHELCNPKQYLQHVPGSVRS